MKVKQSKMSLENLINHFENNIEDESIESNYFENKFNIVKLQQVLKDACVLLDHLAFFHLTDGWFQVELECEKLPPVEDEDIFLFELDNITEFSKEQFLQFVSDKEVELKNLKKQISLLG
jgi:hypothetical protein